MLPDSAPPVVDCVDEDVPGLLDYDWDAQMPDQPAGRPSGPELPNPFALFNALREDERPLLCGPVDMVVAETVRRIVTAWHPLRILLFGSRARGQARLVSDIDLLVELETYTTVQHALLGLYRTIGRTEPSVDLLVACPEILSAHQGQLASVLGQALRDGRVLYERCVPGGDLA